MEVFQMVSVMIFPMEGLFGSLALRIVTREIIRAIHICVCMNILIVASEVCGTREGV
jgi:hypothetical protein